MISVSGIFILFNASSCPSAVRHIYNPRLKRTLGVPLKTHPSSPVVLCNFPNTNRRNHRNGLPDFPVKCSLRSTYGNRTINKVTACFPSYYSSV
ncbi:hypothetical protein L1987_01683 [Smallanthus sonchifolius]|uniref:Uncharacterized protein n=1 Tax=Smallanthus sonchifolius TaxID=185202 RepID=A0ACB9K5S7_9ASTR|nr:hypothetical protein L1987_01683 [Smallanthus sonchifolius]